MNLLFLLVGHLFADFWFQNNDLATIKNRHKAPNINGICLWPYALTAHAATHGMMVAFITSSIYLGIAETILHWLIDFGKCEEWYGIHTDQFLHFICKIGWWLLIA